MLFHKCKDCGKRLSESALSCPKCGALKPQDGWMGISRVAKFAYGSFKYIVFFAVMSILAGVYLHFRQDASTNAAQETAIYRGMSFDLDHAGDFSCSSKERLAELVKYTNKGDQDNSKRLVTEIGESGFCRTVLGSRKKYTVDGVVNVSEIGDVIVFHATDNFDNPGQTLYTQKKFFRPWDNLPPSRPNFDVTASNLKAGTLFYLKDSNFVACESKEALAETRRSRKNGDADNADHPPIANSGKSACFGDDRIFPDDQLEVIAVEKRNDDDSDFPVVMFHRTNFAVQDTFYTSSYNVTPSSPTPSSAN
ncbi:MAG: zinc ribbon domain-containing protein [Burkholderiaceae bacterium]|nr:zinc ribbon domain-containing protein [Burkholderiaceae bacterium]